MRGRQRRGANLKMLSLFTKKDHGLGTWEKNASPPTKRTAELQCRSGAAGRNLGGLKYDAQLTQKEAHFPEGTRLEEWVAVF